MPLRNLRLGNPSTDKVFGATGFDPAAEDRAGAGAGGSGGGLVGRSGGAPCPSMGFDGSKPVTKRASKVRAVPSYGDKPVAKQACDKESQ